MMWYFTVFTLLLINHFKVTISETEFIAIAKIFSLNGTHSSLSLHSRFQANFVNTNYNKLNLCACFYTSEVDGMEFVLQFPMIYEKTSKARGVLLLAHGCQHSVCSRYHSTYLIVKSSAIHLYQYIQLTSTFYEYIIIMYEGYRLVAAFS